MPLANEILQLMKEATKGIGNVGIAAPQIGVLKRMVMFEIPAQHPRYKTDGIAFPMRIMINPCYKLLSDEKNLEWEGCLSVPGMLGQVCHVIPTSSINTQILMEILNLLKPRIFMHVLCNTNLITLILFPMRIENLINFGFTEEIMAFPLFLSR
eukprot:gene13049-27535_t